MDVRITFLYFCCILGKLSASSFQFFSCGGKIIFSLVLNYYFEVVFKKEEVK